jgi:hypothetical protein
MKSIWTITALNLLKRDGKTFVGNKSRCLGYYFSREEAIENMQKYVDTECHLPTNKFAGLSEKS